MYRYNDCLKELKEYFSKYDKNKILKDMYLKDIKTIYMDWFYNNNYLKELYKNSFANFLVRYKYDTLEFLYNLLIDSIEWYNVQYGNNNEN